MPTPEGGKLSCFCSKPAVWQRGRWWCENELGGCCFETARAPYAGQPECSCGRPAAFLRQRWVCMRTKRDGGCGFFSDEVADEASVLVDEGKLKSAAPQEDEDITDEDNVSDLEESDASDSEEKCGFFGCTMPEGHSGPHNVIAEGKRQRKSTSTMIYSGIFTSDARGIPAIKKPAPVASPKQVQSPAKKQKTKPVEEPKVEAPLPERRKNPSKHYRVWTERVLGPNGEKANAAMRKCLREKGAAALAEMLKEMYEAEFPKKLKTVTNASSNARRPPSKTAASKTSEDAALSPPEAGAPSPADAPRLTPAPAPVPSAPAEGPPLAAAPEAGAAPAAETAPAQEDSAAIAPSPAPLPVAPAVAEAPTAAPSHSCVTPSQSSMLPLVPLNGSVMMMPNGQLQAAMMAANGQMQPAMMAANGHMMPYCMYPPMMAYHPSHYSYVYHPHMATTSAAPGYPHGAIPQSMPIAQTGVAWGAPQPAITAGSAPSAVAAAPRTGGEQREPLDNIFLPVSQSEPAKSTLSTLDLCAPPPPLIQLDSSGMVASWPVAQKSAAQPRKKPGRPKKARDEGGALRACVDEQPFDTCLDGAHLQEISSDEESAEMADAPAAVPATDSS
ncbi:hypothetical protein AB1Y20_000618 [Prymnesium parvum]|uniref:Uncharacterized protein n=1 Tax=Prymnesium parvum TaxID=97485 RepID=A0AB34K949_PRYPA